MVQIVHISRAKATLLPESPGMVLISCRVRAVDESKGVHLNP